MVRNATAERSARDLATAWQYRNENRLEPVRQILERHRPAVTGPDRRAYPWRLLNRLARIDAPPLRGHHGPIYCAVFAPDGKSLATAGHDGTLRFWDATSGASLATIDAHSHDVNAIAFSPDGRLIATASQDQTIKIWDAPTHRALEVLSGHADEVVGALFAPDGRRLISGGRQGEVIVWDTADWRKIRTFRAPNAPRLQGLSVSPGGTVLAIAGNRGTFVASLLDGRKIAWLGPEGGPVNCAVFSHDGRFLAEARADSSLRLWNAHDWTVATNVPFSDRGIEGGIKGVAFAPDDRTVAAIGDLGMVHLLDPITLAQDTIATGQGRSWCAVFSPDGRTLATPSSDGTLKLWSLPRDRMHSSVNVPSRSTIDAAFSPNGNELTLADARGRVWIHSARDGRLKAALQLDPSTSSPIVATALAPNARWLIAETQSGAYAIWDLPSGRRREGPLAAPRTDWFAVSPDGRWIVGPRSQTELVLTDAGRTSGPRRIAFERPFIDRVLFSPTSRVLAVRRPPVSGPHLYDIATGRIRKPAPDVPNDLITAQAFSRDAAQLATGTERGMIVVWDVATLEPAAELPGLTTKIESLAFSPDGQTLAVGEEDRFLSLWDVPTRRRLTSLMGHSGPVWLARFSPDGQILASCATAPNGGVQLFLWPTTTPAE